MISRGSPIAILPLTLVLILTGACTGEGSSPPQAEAAIPPECVTTARQGIEILDLGARMVGTRVSSYEALSDLVNAQQRSGLACLDKPPPGGVPEWVQSPQTRACLDVSLAGSAGWSLGAMFRNPSKQWDKDVDFWTRMGLDLRDSIETAAAAWPKCFPGEPLPRNLSLNSPWLFFDRVTYWFMLDLPQTLDVAPGSLLQGGEGGIYLP